MGESAKARRKRKRKNKIRNVNKEMHNIKQRDHSAILAKMRTGAGYHSQGRPDKEESKTCCRKKIDPNDLED